MPGLGLGLVSFAFGFHAIELRTKQGLLALDFDEVLWIVGDVRSRISGSQSLPG